MQLCPKRLDIFRLTKYYYPEKISLFPLLRAEITGGAIMPPPTLFVCKIPPSFEVRTVKDQSERKSLNKLKMSMLREGVNKNLIFRGHQRERWVDPPTAKKKSRINFRQMYKILDMPWKTFFIKTIFVLSPLSEYRF